MRKGPLASSIVKMIQINLVKNVDVEFVAVKIIKSKNCFGINAIFHFMT